MTTMERTGTWWVFGVILSRQSQLFQSTSNVHLCWSTASTPSPSGLCAQKRWWKAPRDCATEWSHNFLQACYAPLQPGGMQRSDQQASQRDPLLSASQWCQSHLPVNSKVVKRNGEMVVRKIHLLQNTVLYGPGWIQCTTQPASLWSSRTWPDLQHWT